MGLGKYIFPVGTYCVVCGKYIDNTRKYGLCDHCIRRMNFGYKEIPCSLDFDFAMSVMGYGLYERRLIFNLKYDGNTYLSRIIADIIYDCIFAMIVKEQECPLLDADIIVPVPIHKRRLKQRGFNQSQRIAKYLGQKLDISVKDKLLIRTKETGAQRALSKEDREANMDGAFRVNPKFQEHIKDKKIIILDDIYTTGATAKACAKALRPYHPEKIYFLSLLFAGNRHHLMVE